MKALLLVDLQNDFCPGGALEVQEGDLVIPIANQLMEHFDIIVASKDWHPADHGSFAANHMWRKPGQEIELNGLPQILWPIHCVQESFGSEFHPGLRQAPIQHIVYKGTDPGIDSYSAFFDNGKKKSTGLADWLSEQQVTELYILGLATDYCVKYTALDAIGLGITTKVIQDACRAVNLSPEDEVKAYQEMEAAGVELIQSKNLL